MEKALGRGVKTRIERLTGGHAPRNSSGCEGLVELDEGLLVVRLPPSQNYVHLNNTTDKNKKSTRVTA